MVIIVNGIFMHSGENYCILFRYIHVFVLFRFLHEQFKWISFIIPSSKTKKKKDRKNRNTKDDTTRNKVKKKKKYIFRILSHLSTNAP